jgi:hypothetical protein
MQRRREIFAVHLFPGQIERNIKDEQGIRGRGVQHELVIAWLGNPIRLGTPAPRIFFGKANGERASVRAESAAAGRVPENRNPACAVAGPLVPERA